MAKLFKVLVVFFLFLGIVIGGALYFISKEIEPNKLKVLIKQTVEKNLPKTELQIGDLSYSLGSKIQFSITDLSLSNRATKNRLANLSRVKIKVPLWAILTKGGTIELDADNPKIYVRKEGETLNWMEILPKSGSEKKAQTSRKIEIPKFVEQSKLSLKVKKIELFTDLDGKKSHIQIKKLSLKNINLKDSTAYRVEASINHQLENSKSIKADINIIGETQIKDLLDGKIKTSGRVEVKKAESELLPMSIPSMIGKYKLDGTEESLNLNFDLSLERLMSASLSAVIQKEVLTLENLEANVNLKEAFKRLKLDLGELPKYLSLKQSVLKLNGKAKYEVASGRIEPSFQYKVEKPIGFSLEGVDSKTSLNGSIESGLVSLFSQTKVFGGTVSTSLRLPVDINNPPKGLESLPRLDVNLDLQGFNVGRKLIQQTLYSDTKPELKESVDDDQPASPIFIPNTVLAINGSNISVGGQAFSLNGTVTTGLGKVSSEKILFLLGKGKLLTKFNAQIETSKNVKSRFELYFKDIEVGAFNAFFPPMINDLKGNFLGEVKGSVVLKDKLSFNINTNVRGINGQLRNFNLGKIVTPMLADIKLLKGKLPKSYKVSDGFKSLVVKANARENSINLNKFALVGNASKVKISSSGTLFLERKNSSLNGGLYVQEIAGEVKKYMGKSSLPYRVRGVGISGLRPDINYTTSQLEKRLRRNVKKQVSKRVIQEKKKMTKKFKKEVKKQQKKLQKNIKNEIKNKLKGIKF